METIKKAVHTVKETAATAFSDSKTKDLKNFIEDDTKKDSFITTDFGTLISDTDNSLRAGPTGPTIMDDFHFREKITHFDHERIPERVVHARGSGAHGYFQIFESLEEYSKADFLCHPHKKTPVFVRFSTVIGFRGSADTVRDVRGFAIKFYTDEGNFDLVGNNFPVFFIQDAIKFPDIIHAAKPHPDNEIAQAKTAHDNFWDFISLTPETTHMIMWALSDRAIPKSYRMMQGFGVNTFVLVNKNGKRRFVKFHLIPELGVHSLVWDEAQKLQGVDADFNRRDLAQAINTGAFPEYDLCIQVVEEEDADKFDFDILDATKVIPEELVPLKRVGRLVLNRNPDNFFSETEQIAFCVQNLVPGIEPSNDPLFQGRMFSYLDTQITRLGGPNFQEIPINRPVCPVTNNQRDGLHRMTINKSQVNYFPNRFGCPGIATAQQGAYVHQPTPISGVKTRARGPKFDEHFSQARLFYNSMSPAEKDHLISAAKFELCNVEDKGVRERMVHNLNKVDHDLAKKVAMGIGVTPPTRVYDLHNKRSPALSQEYYLNKNTIKSRRIAFLIAPGFNSLQLKSISSFLESSDAVPVYIGPTMGPIEDDTGSIIEAHFSSLATRSVQYDGVVIVGGKKSIDTLKLDSDNIVFVKETFKHFKPIAAIDEGVDFLKSIHLPVSLAPTEKDFVEDQGVVTTRKFPESPGKEPFGFTKELFKSIAAHRHWYRNVSNVDI